MTQSELITNVAKDVNTTYEAEGKKALSKEYVGDVVKSFVKVTTDAIVNGDKVQIAGFGTFESVKREAREGRNPVTGEKMTIPAKNAPKFKAAKALKDALNA